ncbi:MAG: MATE family efflux transporter [Muribaculaceae bacterium]|nr:MATE family efflux transporter [Muribaculaceae bacterium]
MPTHTSPGAVWKSRPMRIIRLGLPILIGQLGMIVVGFADTTMVGNYSTDALASASFVNNLFNVCIFACIGFTYGLTPLLGALFTQKRYSDIGSYLRSGLWLNILFALFITAIMSVIYFNLHRLGQPEELLPLIRPYYLIYLAGLIPVAVFNVFAQWAYSINRTKMPMWIILCANAVNIAGNYALIEGHWGMPELGLTGAGLATFIARILCPVAIIAVFFAARKYSHYRTGFTSVRTARGVTARIASTSWPVSLQMALESGSFTVAAVMAGWIGAIALASFQIVVITGTLGFCVYYSVAAAVSVLVANAAGLSDRREMRLMAFAGFKILLALATCSSLLFYFAGPQIMGIFTDDARVIALSLSLIVPMILYQYGDATQINFANALRGTSNVMPMVWIAAVSYLVVGIPATYILAFPCGLGCYGIILSFSISLFLAAGLFMYYFMRSTRLGHHGGKKMP